VTGTNCAPATCSMMIDVSPITWSPSRNTGDRRRRPQLGQLGAVEVALLLEDVVGDALLVERDPGPSGSRAQGCS
jgi:hypothetical protein